MITRIERFIILHTVNASVLQLCCLFLGLGSHFHQIFTQGNTFNTDLVHTSSIFTLCIKKMRPPLALQPHFMIAFFSNTATSLLGCLNVSSHLYVLPKCKQLRQHSSCAVHSLLPSPKSRLLLLT